MSAIGPERVRREIQARFNPIRGLTPERLSQELDQFKLGYLRQMALTWEAMEDRDLHLKNVAMKRKKAVARHGWEILTVDDSPEAEAQKEALKFFYENIRVTSVMDQDQQGGVSLLVRQMMDAVGKKYAVHEMVWRPVTQRGMRNAERGTENKKRNSTEEREGRKVEESLNGEHRTSNIQHPTSNGSVSNYLTAEFRFCPLWFFENRTGRLQFLQQEYALEGVEMRPEQWLVTVGDGIMEGCAVAYMFKHLPLKDWLAFSEKFGMPGVLGKTGSKKGSAEWDAMLEAVKNFANDWAAVCSAGEAIETVEVKSGQTLPQPPLIEYCDKRMAAAWRGADLSTISGTGPDSSGASLQGDEESVLQEDDAKWISETLNNRVDCQVMRLMFGTDECLAYIKILTEQKDTIDRDIKIDEFLTRHGVPVSVDECVERLGRSLPEAGVAVLEAPAATSVAANGVAMPGPEWHRGNGTNGTHRTNGTNALENEGAEALQTRAKEALAKALAEDLAPVRERLERILGIEDEGILRERLASFLAELPRLVKDIGADPESARVFEAATTAAMFNGFDEATQRRT